MKFSANLGFLWTELSLPDAIRKARASGFDAVECHFPYNTPPESVRDALAETGMSMLGLNTQRGNVPAGDNGLCAIPGREVEARQVIDEAIDYTRAIDCRNVHIMSGIAAGDAAHSTLLTNLRYACKQRGDSDITLLIEPLNRNDAPGYFLRTTDQAMAIIAELDLPGVKLMFDCYHVGRTEGDLLTRLQALMPHVGHIQFASVPDRGSPDHGEINFAHVFREIDALGYVQPLGAEYKPVGPTDDTLGWMQTLV